MIEWTIIALSLLVNIFGFLYCRFLIGNLVNLSESVKDMRTLISGYKEHISQLYELEMFYGDETLKSMIDHSKFVVEKINEYEDSLSLTGEPEEDTDAAAQV